MHTERARARARCARFLPAAAALLLLAGMGDARAEEPATNEAGPAPAGDGSPEGMSLSGGQDGTVFGSLTVTGEDRVHIEFERPELNLDLDPREAPGLEWGNPLGVLQRSGIDRVEPFLATSTATPVRGLADAWTDGYRTDGVARFQPQLDDVHRWRLEILDSHSDTVAVFEGKGDPPDDLVWDGLRPDGTPATPGLAYSYVLVASDKAGNSRTFPGSGFELPPYRLEDDGRQTFLLAGSDLPAGWVARRSGPAPALLIEAASRINQQDLADSPVEIRAGGRSFEEARALGEAVSAVLGSYLLGDPSRLRVVTDVRTDAPAGGTVAITSPAAQGDA
jgi:hypothetical protein